MPFLFVDVVDYGFKNAVPLTPPDGIVIFPLSSAFSSHMGTTLRFEGTDSDPRDCQLM